MSLVFDLEYLGKDPCDLDDEVRAFLVRGCETQEQAIDALSRTALSPYTGEIIVAAAHDTERGSSVVLAVTDHELPADDETTAWRACASEKELLEKFWSICSRQYQWVTYGGRFSDAHYLLVRSIVNGVEYDQRLTHAIRFRETHIDLADWLTNYGAARSRCSLDLLCRALGVPTPKDGIDGSRVGEFWRAGKHVEVARYCLADVLATAECAYRCRVVSRPRTPESREVVGSFEMSHADDAIDFDSWGMP